jgi:hypothetical protein
VSQIIATTMDDLDFKLPEPPADPDEISELHRAAAQETETASGGSKIFLNAVKSCTSRGR